MRNSERFSRQSSRGMNLFRRNIIIIAVVWLVIGTVLFSIAWFSGTAINRGNVITTKNQNLRLLTMDFPKTVLSEDGTPTVAPDFPLIVSDLFADDNVIISIDTYDNDYGRMFLEFDGKSAIQGVSANFRQQRALIVANESAEVLNYSLAFNTRELGKNSLSSAFYFNYTRVGGGISNRDLHDTSGVKLNRGKTVENLGVSIAAIGGSKPVTILPNSSHIYIVDMGILESAGNTYLDAGLQLDIVLSTSKGGVATYFANDAKTFEAAMDDNIGGATIILNGDIEIDKPLTSDRVFNLDLNGYILSFVEDGMLEIEYPAQQATMDIGSLEGGRIYGAESMEFIGVNGKSVLNWYPEITGLDRPSLCEDVIVNSLSIPNYTPPSSKPPVNSGESSGNGSSDSSGGNSDDDSSNNSSGSSGNGSSDNSSGSSGNDSSDNSSGSSGDNSGNSSGGSSNNGSGDDSGNSSGDSSSNTSSENNLTGYINYHDITATEDYLYGAGIASDPFILGTIEEFKQFIEDGTTSKSTYFALDFTVSHLKNIPAHALSKVATLEVWNDHKLEYLDFSCRAPSDHPENPFKNIIFYKDGFVENYSDFIFEVTYNGVKP